jgi:hypothetical protein
MTYQTKPIISISILCLAFIISYALSAQAESLELSTSSDVAEPISNTSDVPAQVAPTLLRDQDRLMLPKRAQERIINLAANISNRMDATVYRFDQIIIRLERRIAKSTTEGFDVALAETTLTEAKTALEKARTSLESIDTTVTEAVSSDTPRQDIANLQVEYQNNIRAFRETKGALQKTIALLKNPTTVEVSTSSAPTDDVN